MNRETIYNHYLDLRSLLYFIDSADFDNSIETMELIKRCQDPDPLIRAEGFRKLKQKQKITDDEPSVKDLKILAQQLGIGDYSRMNKADLLSEIKRVEKVQKQSSKLSGATSK